MLMSDIAHYHILKVFHICFIGISWIFHGYLKYTSKLSHSIYLEYFSSVFINGFNAMICNHMTLIHLVRITAITQQFQVIFRCRNIPSWSCYNAFLELKAPLGLAFKLLIIIAFVKLQARSLD